MRSGEETQKRQANQTVKDGTGENHQKAEKRGRAASAADYNLYTEEGGGGNRRYRGMGANGATRYTLGVSGIGLFFAPVDLVYINMFT